MKYTIDDLIELGRDMLSRAESMVMSDDEQVVYANKLNRLGNMIVHIGQPFGTTFDDFSREDQAFILREFKNYLARKQQDRAETRPLVTA